jgi:serine phosphatase RsbU (regulator of sigma subunit)/PAS domain-containing protein
VCPRKQIWLLPALGDSQGPHPDEQRCRNYHVKGSSSRNRSFRRFFLGVLRDRYGSVSDTSGMRRGDTCEECQSYHATSPRPTDTGLKHPLESRRGTGSHRGSGRFLSYLGSVAGQVFVLQIILVGLLVTAAVMALALFAQKATVRDARHESLAAARAFANAPGTVAALESRNPTAVLQPRAVAAVKGTNLQWVSVLSPHGIRWAYPNPKYLGKRWPGDMSPWLNGRSRIVQAHIPPSLPSHLPGGRDYIQAEVPVLGPDGSLAGVVFAGLKVKTVNSMVAQQLPIIFGAGAGALVTSTVGTVLVSRRLRRQTRGLRPIDLARMYEHHDAVLHAVREGVLIVGADGRLLLVNDEAQRLLGLPTGAEGRDMGEVGLDGRTTGLLVSGESVTDEVHLIGDRLLAVNKRPTAPYGGQAGSVVTLRDTTELAVVSGRAEQARERLKLLYDAGVQVGTTLDVVRTAEELSQVVVPRFADVVAVDLLDVVVQGQEPVGEPWRQMRRTAVSGPLDGLPLYPVGELITFTATTPQARALETGRAQLEADLRAAWGWQEQDPGRAQRALEYGLHSLITVPLQARGVVLGMVSFWRSAPSPAFEEDDLSFAEELAMRAALCIDNARRFTREHAMAVTLQRSLLPRGLPEQNALEVAWRYLPAQAGVGGDWFDVIPLPGARVALVVGDVIGHGLHAAATMGRLRTAVHTFSTMDLSAGELLGHLDELVAHMDADESTEEDHQQVTGATCLYAIYDAVCGTCTIARAGHLGPALIHPNGAVSFPDTPLSPPLGLSGSLPVETGTLHLPEASWLALFTDGLIENRHRDLDTGLELLRDVLTHGHPTPEQTCQAVVDALLPERPQDDVALLIARTRIVNPAHVREWEVPSDPAVVPRIRFQVSRQLKTWGLEQLAFATELIASELVTNAIRYGTQPTRLRLLHDHSLVCEVADGSSTSPHLRRAATTDEGGRGLFLVAQFSQRWGTRYTAHGKIIWTEQSLHDNGAAAGAMPPEALLDQWGE